MRLLYLILSYLLTPLVVVVLLSKGMANKAYLERMEERFGFGRTRTDRPSLWVHAVSVGEVVAASAMIRWLRQAYLDVPVVLTTVTPTGAQRVRDLFGNDVIHSYVPYDTPGSVKRFFNRFHPQLAIVMETEVWPNLYNECGRRRVPLVLANARVSTRSVSRYRRFFSLFKETLSHGIVIAAQSERDASRFRSLGASSQRTHVVGNVKFDMVLPEGVAEMGRAFRERHAGDRPVWIAASTHEGEEKLVLEAHARILRRWPDALLLLIPRHPERFSAVAALIARQGLRFVRRSSAQSCGAGDAVFLGDTLGEMMIFYGASDVAFVGGSLVPVGGHNMLEPAALGLPILAGPHNYNAQDIADMMIAGEAASIVFDADELAEQVGAHFADPEMRARRGASGRHIVAENRGATDRMLRLLEPLLENLASGAGVTPSASR
jgi:3-deoxy-D-manno-octulosonic-acid transferase